MEDRNIYQDIAERTQGDIYIGVVGPVRTGKSTFIKRFMDTLVLPNITGDYQRERATDELPQSAAGRTIMTTEPKFIPEDAVEIALPDQAHFKVRMIDCVGYIVPSSLGYIEGDQPRMVKTPWYENEIPFNMAAEIGTRKVISEHSTIGLVITTDGSISDIPRAEYEEAEERVVKELKELNKPFIVLLNCMYPQTNNARALASQMTEKYGVPVLPVNCLELEEEEIRQILSQVLFEFPITEVEFYVPKWVEMLSTEHELKAQILTQIREHMQKLTHIRDITKDSIQLTGPYVQETLLDQIDLSSGIIRIRVQVRDEYYYKILSELSGITMESEYDLIHTMKELTNMKEQYVKVRDALEAVRSTGYGVVVPELSEIQIETPTVIRQGNKFGVKIRSKSPSIHMIKANIETEIAPDRRN